MKYEIIINRLLTKERGGRGLSLQNLDPMISLRPALDPLDIQNNISSLLGV